MYELVPVQRYTPAYINGLQLSWTSNSTLTVADGAASDSTNSNDIVVNTAGVGTVISNAFVGLNGLDTGTVAASTMYYVYAIADMAGFNAPGFVISTSSTIPIMPAGQNPSGYSLYRLIGFALTDSSSHFLLFYMDGVASSRFYQYDAPVSVTVSASGTSSTYSPLDLSVAVPVVNFGRVQVYYQWTNNAAADILNFQPTGGTGDSWTKKGIAAGVQQDENMLILPLLATAKPEISYKTSAGTLNAVKVQGFEFNL